MRFVVYGDSMRPLFEPGDKLRVSVIIYKIMRPRVGDVVVVRDPRTGRLILKRIKRLEGAGYFVLGDNPMASTDSREFGVIHKNEIVGRVVRKYGGLVNSERY